MPRLARLTTFSVAVLITLWVFWLRWPTFDYAVWNLDEGIYATVGRTILEGGVMYRDVIDHRGPVCHYLTAAILAVAGINNVWAMHATLAGMIAVIAFLLFRLGTLWRGKATGVWAAAVFAALSTDLLYVGDAYSVSTEWFLILFSTLATWWFWVSWPRGGFWAPFVCGVGYGVAFLSKQPGLLEVGAPVFLLIYLAATQRQSFIQASRVLGGLVSGFTVLLALVFGYFWWHDTLGSFYFYGWTYNLLYYGADTSLADRLDAAQALPRMIGAEYPLLLGLIAIGVFWFLYLFTRDRPSTSEKNRQPSAFFLLCWLALSSAGAAAAGRVHAHYYIQAMPALSLAAAWVLGAATDRSFSPGRGWLRIIASLLVVIATWNMVTHPLKGRARPGWGSDSARIPADFINTHSLPTDRIFVWGIYPDFYVFADRAPASRYIYTSFQTGVQPGKNTAPGINTDYAVVPGSLEALLKDLDATRPVFFVDSSFGNQRIFEKYPLSRFPRLAAFVENNYVEVKPVVFRPHGFRVLMIKDSFRHKPLKLTDGLVGGQLDEPSVSGFAVSGLVPKQYNVRAAHTAGRLQRLELLVNGQPTESISFQPASSMDAIFTVHFEQLGSGRHRLALRATSSSGETKTGPEFLVNCTEDFIQADQLKAFALPEISRGPAPLQIRAPFGASVEREGRAVIYFAHAPSSISYPVSKTTVQISGRYGFKPGAYAAGNTARTDGAEFIINWISPTGKRTELMRQLLTPWENPSHRGDHPFNCFLPTGHQGGTLELVVGDGPSGSPTSDWTYWADLLLIERL